MAVRNIERGSDRFRKALSGGFSEAEVQPGGGDAREGFVRLVTSKKKKKAPTTAPEPTSTPTPTPAPTPTPVSEPAPISTALLGAINRSSGDTGIAALNQAAVTRASKVGTPIGKLVSSIDGSRPRSILGGIAPQDGSLTSKKIVDTSGL